MEFELNLTCSNENIENIIKKIRSLITSISSESIEDDTQKTNIAKKTIFDVFLMDFEENNDIQTEIQREIVKISKILGFSLKKLRVNTQKINVEDFDFFENRKPLKTYTIQEIPNNRYFSNKNRILFEKFNEYRIFLWVSDFMPYFINVLFLLFFNYFFKKNKENDEKVNFFQSENNYFCYFPSNFTSNPSIFSDFSLKILNDLLNLHSFHRLLDSISNHLSVSFPHKLPIQAYHFREKQLLLNKLQSDLKVLERLQSDDDIKFPMETHKKV